MELKRIFKKDPVDAAEKGRESGRASSEGGPAVPDGLLKKCPRCGKGILTEEYVNKGYICPKCGGYLRMPAQERIIQVTDPDTFEEWDRGLFNRNPLRLKGYPDRIRLLQETTGLDEAVVTGRGKIQGHPVVLMVMDCRFLTASMGEVAGEKITLGVEQATREGLPVVIFCCSGGARMQEGIISLMQMAKTAAALKRHSDAGLLYISVLTDPTTGGVTASFAMLGDIILAEPGALVGFAGPRVIEQTIRQKLPKGFQRSEFLLEHGFVDRIVRREEMKETLGLILDFHKKPVPSENNYRESAVDKMGSEKPWDENVPDDPGEKPWDKNAAKNPEKTWDESMPGNPEKPEKPWDESVLGDAGEKPWDKNVAKNPEEKTWDRSGQGNPGETSSNRGKKTAWERVQLARSKDRPVAQDYLELLFQDYLEFHGDRQFGDDPAISGGIAYFQGHPVTVIAQMKGKDTKENVKRNFAMPLPEGYHKALRLMKQAEKFHRPVICLVDTPGAFCGMEAEQRGQGEAIARNLYEMSALQTPILSIFVGEGGSGGALALAVADEVWVLENAVYSILSPEGFASILWKDASQAEKAARVMGLTSYDLYRMGIVEAVIPEPEAYTRNNMAEVCDCLKNRIDKFLQDKKKIPASLLAEERYRRFREL